MKTLYLTRHGETEYTSAGLIQGALDIPLNGLGISQAYSLAENLESLYFDNLTSSNLMRARQTAEIISEKTGLELKIDNLLRPINFGDFEGKSWKACKKMYPEEYAEAKKLTMKYKFPNGESGNTHVLRVIEFLDNIFSTNDDKHHLIVGHSGAINLMTGIFEGIPSTEFYKLRLDPCTYREYSVEPSEYSFFRERMLSKIDGTRR